MGDNNNTKNLGYRYISYMEKYNKFTREGAQSTPFVGLKTRDVLIPGYKKGPVKDGKQTYIDTREGVNITVPAEQALTQDAPTINVSQNFESKSILKVVDLISEGPIEGFCSRNGETLSYFANSQDIPQAEEEFLQSVYFDGTKVLNPDIGTLNYRLANIDFRPGTGRQSPLPMDYQFASQTIPINTRLIPSPFWQYVGDNNETGKTVKDTLGIGAAKKEGKNEGRERLKDWEGVETIGDLREEFQKFEKALEPVSHTIQNHLVEEVTVNIKIHVLSTLRVGKRTSERIGSECSFLIYVGNESGPFSEKLPVLCEGSPSADVVRADSEEDMDKPLVRNDTGGYFVRIARGIATSDYIFETKFHLPPNIRNENRIVKVFRIERDLGYEADDPQIECSLESVVESIPFKLRYPYSAVIGSTIDSTATSRIPKREYDLKLLRVKVPSNYIPENKQYFGNWSGKFKSWVAVADENEAEYRVKRALANVTNRAKSDGTKQIKVKTGVKKHGSGSILFPSSSGLDVDADFAKRISIKDQTFKYPIEEDDGPKRTLRISDFGFQNFTIEFFIKVAASDVKTIYAAADGSSSTTSGLAGFYKTIISSGEGDIPCGGANESDANRNDSELYKHPVNRQSLNYASGAQQQNSLPVAGNWAVEIGTENGGEAGQIFFRYFVYGAYYRPAIVAEAGTDYERVSVLDAGNKPTVAAKVVLKSTESVADNDWHHVAITREHDTFKVWIDGEDQTDGSSTSTYDGDVRGFVYRSGTQKDSGLIEIGNDRSLRLNSSGTPIHSSFNGYLDMVHVIRRCKYTSDFTDSYNQRTANTKETVLLLAGDDQPDNGTKIVDYNPPITIPKSTLAHFENFGSAFLQWTDNPAWIFYDLITNKRYGLGKYGINSDFVNKWNIYELGKYCDQLVKTGWSSRYKARNFQVVKPDDADSGATYSTQAAGEVLVKINELTNQAEFLREYPRHSTVAIFDLNDGKKPVKRVIEYLKVDGQVEDGDGRYHSWLNDDVEKTGSIVIKLLRPLAVEECFLLNPELKEVIIREQWNKRETATGTYTSRRAGLGPKRIIYDRYGDYAAVKGTKDNDGNLLFAKLSGDSDILEFFFEGEYVTGEDGKRTFADGKGGLKINSTSVSGKIATEFTTSREILEPRFTCNLYITTAIDAFKVLNDLASVFLGLTYIVGGKVFASFDKPRDPIMNFTNSNVKDGSFVYAGSPKTSRFTTALVRYVDKYENFKPKVEYVEDASGIIKYGLIEKELIAFGCTSRGQARRLGKWFLFSAQLETDSIQFTAGKEASYLRPGDVVKVIDKNKTRKRYGGRIIDVSSSAKQITLDGAVNENVVGETITIAIPSSFETEETLDQRSMDKRVSDQDLANLRRPQIKEFKVSSVDDDGQVPNRRTIIGLTALDDSDAEGIGKIKTGAIWILQNQDANLKIQEILFRVMNIEEENPMEYKVSCLEYNRSKFKASEDDAEADSTNVSAIALGGSGQIEQKEQAKGAFETTEEDYESPTSDYNLYKVTGVETAYTPKSGTGTNIVKESILISWAAPSTIPSSYTIVVWVEIDGNEPNPDGSVSSEVLKEIKENFSAVDKDGQNVLSWTLYPWEIFGGKSEWWNYRNAGNIVNIEVRSVVDGNEVSAGLIEWSNPGG